MHKISYSEKSTGPSQIFAKITPKQNPSIISRLQGSIPLLISFLREAFFYGNALVAHNFIKNVELFNAVLGKENSATYRKLLEHAIATRDVELIHFFIEEKKVEVTKDDLLGLLFDDLGMAGGARTLYDSEDFGWDSPFFASSNVGCKQNLSLLDTVKLLFKKGADVNAEYGERNVIMLAFVLFNSAPNLGKGLEAIEIIKFLLANGAKPETIYWYGIEGASKDKIFINEAQKRIENKKFMKELQELYNGIEKLESAQASEKIKASLSLLFKYLPSKLAQKDLTKGGYLTKFLTLLKMEVGQGLTADAAEKIVHCNKGLYDFCSDAGKNRWKFDIIGYKNNLKDSSHALIEYDGNLLTPGAAELLKKQNDEKNVMSSCAAVVKIKGTRLIQPDLKISFGK
ncbi:MAG: hypothetical protein M1549_03940 [Candidatus Dependentiae bacterium]|nr:hypothetical protein [Candidatus Dependentiae bacterium]